MDLNDDNSFFFYFRYGEKTRVLLCVSLCTYICIYVCMYVWMDGFVSVEMNVWDVRLVFVARLFLQQDFINAE